MKQNIWDIIVTKRDKVMKYQEIEQSNINKGYRCVQIKF